MIQQVAAEHLGWGQAASLDTRITYEWIIWVPHIILGKLRVLLGAS